MPTHSATLAKHAVCNNGLAVGKMGKDQILWEWVSANVTAMPIGQQETTLPYCNVAMEIAMI
jgi:hypothetical protein